MVVALVAGPAAYAQPVQAGDSSPTEAPECQPPDAECLFAQGVAATDRGDFAAGLRAFEAAYALNPLPDTLYNIGMCRMALEDGVGAANAFRDYVAARGGRLTAEEQAELDGVLAELTPRIGRLAVRAGQDGAVVTIDGAAAGVTPLAAWVAVAPGRHTVAAQKDGFEPASSVVDVAAGQLLDVPLVLVARAEGPDPWFWTSVGVGGAATVGMAITGGLALKYRDDYAERQWADRDLHDTAADLAVATDVLLGVALAGAAAALIIGLWPEEEASGAGADVGLAVVPGGVAVLWCC
jgi:tetratricopeptide (TPR) repeat protein